MEGAVGLDRPRARGVLWRRVRSTASRRVSAGHAQLAAPRRVDAGGSPRATRTRGAQSQVADIDAEHGLIVWPGEFQKGGKALEQPITWNPSRRSRPRAAGSAGRQDASSPVGTVASASPLKRCREAPTCYQGMAIRRSPTAIRRMWVALIELEVSANGDRRIPLTR
jgi:hypothetical protein